MRTTTVDAYCSYTGDSCLHGTISVTIAGLSLAPANVHTLQLCEMGNDDELAAAAAVAISVGGDATADLILESAALTVAMGARNEINARLYLWDATDVVPAYNGRIKIRWAPAPTGYVVTTPGTTAITAAQASQLFQDTLDAAPAETTPVDAWKILAIVAGVLSYVTWANIKLVLCGISVGATLPTTSNSVYRLCVLTAADATAKAGPGLYWWDGTGWLCLVCAVPYAWGNLGATPTTALIAGCDYVFVRDQAITGWTLTLSRPGVCNWTLTGAFACADPTCTGRTFVERETTWSDNIVSALIEGAFRDDGTRMICSAVELNT